MATNPLAKLSAKKQKYVKELANGSSKKDALLAAGYAESTAKHPGLIETPDVQAAFKYAMRNRIRVDRIAQRIDEGLDATATKYFAHNGVVMDSREVVDYQERRHYAAIAAEMAGYWSPKQEIDVTQKIDESTARRLADIAEKIGLMDMEWDERKALRESYVVLDATNGDNTDGDSDEDDTESDTPEVIDQDDDKDDGEDKS